LISSFIFKSFDLSSFVLYTPVQYENFLGISSNQSRIREKYDLSRIQIFNKKFYLLKKELRLYILI